MDTRLRTDGDRMISVIMPTFNSERTIDKSIKSILSSDYDDYEIVVADGGSKDRTIEIIRSFNEKKIHLIQKKDNGAAQGRNNGAKVARGEILFFVDSDVLIKRNTLNVLANDFKNPEIVAASGCYDKTSVDNAFGPSYDSMRKHYDWISVKDKYCNFFSTARGAVRKEIFFSLSGFNENLEGTLANEDLEFGWRLLNAGHKILKEDSVEVIHFGPSLRHNMKMFYIRSGNYFRLFMKKKKFENVKTTKGSAMNCMLAFLGTITLPIFWVAGVLMLFVHLVQNMGFFRFVRKEKGIVFTFKSIAAQYLLALAAASGFVTTIISILFKR